MTDIPVSVVILTKNEEVLIARCVRSVLWADEVLVLDSGSTDQTCAIARELGAVVYVQPWLGWTAQHRKGVELARNPWILTIDADEIVTDHLRGSIKAAMCGSPDPRDGYAVDRRDDFMGRLVFNTRRRGKINTFVRLFHRDFSNYDERLSIHEEIRCPGRSIRLDGLLLHCRDSSIEEIVGTFNRNSNIEAQEIVKQKRRLGVLPVLLMPPLRLMWVYFICGNWRLGARGFVLAGTYGVAEFLRQAKAWEIEFRSNNPKLDLPPEPNTPAAKTDQKPGFRQIDRADVTG